jgi:hypothetical protein
MFDNGLRAVEMAVASRLLRTVDWGKLAVGLGRGRDTYCMNIEYLL